MWSSLVVAEGEGDGDADAEKREMEMEGRKGRKGRQSCMSEFMFTYFEACG